MGGSHWTTPWIVSFAPPYSPYTKGERPHGPLWLPRYPGGVGLFLERARSSAVRNVPPQEPPKRSTTDSHRPDSRPNALVRQRPAGDVLHTWLVQRRRREADHRRTGWRSELQPHTDPVRWSGHCDVGEHHRGQFVSGRRRYGLPHRDSLQP